VWWPGLAGPPFVSGVCRDASPLSTGYFYCGSIFETRTAALIGNLTAVKVRQFGDEELVSVENATLL